MKQHSSGLGIKHTALWVFLSFRKKCSRSIQSDDFFIVQSRSVSILLRIVFSCLEIVLSYFRFRFLSIFIREGACKFLVKSLWCKFSRISLKMSDKISSKKDNTRRKSSRINSEDSHGVTNIVDATPWPDPEAILKESSRKSETEGESD